MPYPNFQRPLNPTQKPTLQWLNDVVHSQNNESRYFSDIQTEFKNKLPGMVVTNIFQGTITNAGPNGEKDYIDPRYWVTISICDPKLITKNNQQYESIPDPRWTTATINAANGSIVNPTSPKNTNIITATNLNEMPDGPGTFELIASSDNNGNTTYKTISTSGCGSHLLYTTPTSIASNADQTTAQNKTNTVLVYEVYTMDSPQTTLYVFSQEPERWRICQLIVSGNSGSNKVDCTVTGTNNTLYTYDLFDYAPAPLIGQTRIQGWADIGPPLINYSVKGTSRATSAVPLMQRYPSGVGGAGISVTGNYRQSYIVPAQIGIANYCRTAGDCAKWQLVWCDEVAPEPVLVTCTVASGSNGGISWPATYEYDFFDAITGVKLDTTGPQAPLFQYPRQNGPIVSATYGWAEFIPCLNGSGFYAWGLVEANEKMQTIACTNTGGG